PAGTHITVQREDGLISGGQAADSERQLIRFGDSGTSVDLKGMTHRSLAKLTVRQLEDRQLGQVEFDISINEQGVPQGTVTNKTIADLTDTAIILNDKMYLLGDIARNQTAAITSLPLTINHYDYGYFIFPSQGNRLEDMKLERPRGLVNAYFSRNNMTDNYAFIGWSQDELMNYEVNGKKVAADPLNMWVQRIEPEIHRE